MILYRDIVKLDGFDTDEIMMDKENNVNFEF